MGYLEEMTLKSFMNPFCSSLCFQNRHASGTLRTGAEKNCSLTTSFWRSASVFFSMWGCCHSWSFENPFFYFPEELWQLHFQGYRSNKKAMYTWLYKSLWHCMDIVASSSPLEIYRLCSRILERITNLIIIIILVFNLWSPSSFLCKSISTGAQYVALHWKSWMRCSSHIQWIHSMEDSCEPGKMHIFQGTGGVLEESNKYS
jgi:hypothetical protein